MNLPHLIRKIKLQLIHLLWGKSLTRIQLNDWLKTISVNTERVLEVGASHIPVINKVKLWNVKDYKTLDNNSEAQCNPTFQIDLNLLIWSDKFGWISKNKSEEKTIQKALKYTPNVLFCLEVMEYIYKPDTVLKFFYDLLAPKGILYISFHTIYPIHEPCRFDSLRYTKWGIIHLLEEAGFAKWEITPRRASKGRGSLALFFKEENMKGTNKRKELLDIGYLIKATK